MRNQIVSIIQSILASPAPRKQGIDYHITYYSIGFVKVNHNKKEGLATFLPENCYPVIVVYTILRLKRRNIAPEFFVLSRKTPESVPGGTYPAAACGG